jgi:superkiller protein 3
MVYLSQERWTEAEQAFQTALAADPCDARGHSGLGIALREQGRLEEAIDAYTRAVGLLHHQPAAHLQLGITLLQAGKLDWAIRALEVTVSLDPEEARAHRLLAEVYRTYRIDPVRAAGHARRAQCIEDGRKAQESGA